MNRLLLVAGAMTIQYALLVANMRAVAAGSYPWTISTDAVIALNALFLTRAAIDAKTIPERAAYVVGGCCGSAIALWLSGAR